MQHETHREELDLVVQRWEQATDPTLSPIEKDARVLELFDAQRAYLSNFTDDVVSQTMFLAQFYKYLATVDQ